MRTLPELPFEHLRPEIGQDFSGSRSALGINLSAAVAYDSAGGRKI